MTNEKQAPAGELLPCPFCGESAETDFIPEHHSYQIECSDCIGCYGRVIRDTEIGAIDAWNRRAADRELRRGDVAMPLLPEPHFGDGRYLGIALNGDAFTAAQMREYAQAALAAKDAEIAALKANRDRWKAIALMYNTKYSEGTVEITALKAERDALKVDAERLDWVALQDLSEFDIQFIFDAPHEGEYSVGTEYGTFYGLTLREAIDAAIAKAVQP